ncbi:hypothetical protein BGX38DRAFT_1274824 [Terfezia claveryi]|nr:hypothetical protein BGX38DRAFT_1274824 [Terfezia claveryi]
MPLIVDYRSRIHTPINNTKDILRTLISSVELATTTLESKPDYLESTSNLVTTTNNPTTPTNLKHANPTTESRSISGLSRGAKIGIGVAIPILFLLIGGAICFYFRRKRHQCNEKGEVGEVMIIGGKHGHLDEDQSSGPSGPTAIVHPGSTPQVSDGHMYAPPAMHDPSGYEQGTPGVQAVIPVARRSPADEEEFMQRPVSPVHDNLLTEEVGGTIGGSSGTALSGSVRDRGSPTLDDDREMEWILEEERKAKERREQQGRLPHSPLNSMGV